MFNSIFAIFICSNFDGDEQSAYETNGGNVVVVGSAGSHDHGSSKIKLKNIVDYKWEVKNYIGRLIAVHLEGKYVAYAIKGKHIQTFGGKHNLIASVCFNSCRQKREHRRYGSGCESNNRPTSAHSW